MIRAAVPADAARLAEFAARTFHETFVDSTPPEDMRAFLAKTYNEAEQASEIADPGIVTFVYEVDGELAAFAQLKLEDDPSRIELGRLYVDRTQHGRGIAHAMMQRCLDEAAARGAETIWLGVWEHNERAKAFYRKHGFVATGEHVFIVGSDVQTDQVMERPVGRGSGAASP
jgi:ribosomal protein S18 acetylase RimI-like enzyme